MVNEKLINKLNELYEIYNAIGDKYRANSYKKTINIIHKYPTEITIHNLSQIDTINGIGEKTIKRIKEYLRTGHIKTLDDLKKRKDINAHLELQQILGIGPKMSKELIKKNIKSIDELRNSKIKLNKIQRIGLKYYSNFKKPIPRSYMLKYKKDLEKKLKRFDKNINLILAGSYLTGKKFGNDIDIILTTNNKINSTKLKTFLIENDIAREIINYGKSSIMYVSKGKQHVDLKIVDNNLLPYYLIYFGSGETFSRDIRLAAKKRGYKLSQYGLFDRKTGKKVLKNVKNEKEIFNKIGIPYIKPQNR